MVYLFYKHLASKNKKRPPEGSLSNCKLIELFFYKLLRVYSAIYFGTYGVYAFLKP